MEKENRLWLKKKKDMQSGKDQKILQRNIEELDKKIEEHSTDLELAEKDQIVASKSFIYVIIALLIYLTFLVIPDIEEKVTWMEKDLKFCTGSIRKI